MGSDNTYDYRGLEPYTRGFSFYPNEDLMQVNPVGKILKTFSSTSHFLTVSNKTLIIYVNTHFTKMSTMLMLMPM